jgi:TPR repeat protein
MSNELERPTDDNVLRAAKAAIESGAIDVAARLLEGLIEKGNSEAMCLRAEFGSATESQEEFDARRMKLLRRAAELDHPDALYELGIHLETGDGIQQNQVEALECLKRAAALGQPNALWQVGEMHLYGTRSCAQDTVLGLSLIEKAAALKSQGALRSLAEFYQEGNFGYEKDAATAARLRADSDADDVMPI